MTSKLISEVITRGKLAATERWSHAPLNGREILALIAHIEALEKQLAAERARMQWPIPWPIPARFDYQSDEEYAGAIAMLHECKNSVKSAGIPVEGE
ncbi:hypothetical protein [Dickeya solani]|uniref:Uncharacterized protein n=1 Tax=Dickeya solani TaxID=1089444 RepID=A0ABU4EPB5_9GAMM|nr:hypothetical protein [Dickeya solani]MCA6998188.1 hypothetical protein [Dickeya solani]MCA6999517.1 hypothetical protein [Dickeya solani]MCZ0823869.1 hypothetical protein [Dickeya solani]MDV6997225.1 hypothetical protein [Dickeya solani]MDV7006505.1 hypothetical protein [Dickeya solani]